MKPGGTLGQGLTIASAAMALCFMCPLPQAKAAAQAVQSSPLFVAAPIRINGQIRYTFASYFGITDPSVPTTYSQGIELTATARTRAYIWQPWFIQLAAQLGARLSRDMADRNTNHLSLLGGADLRALPRSRYPLYLFITQSTDSPENDLFGVERVVTRYGVQQQYLARNSTLYLLSYNATSISNRSTLASVVGDTFTDLTALDIYFRRPGADFRFKAAFLREQQNQIGRRHWARELNLEHRFRPRMEFDMNTLAAYNHTTDRGASGPYNKTKFSQISSGFFWTPRQAGVQFSGFVSANQSKTDKQTTNSARANLGARVWRQVGDHWRLTANASAAKAKDENAVFTQAGTASYIDQTRLGNWTYYWNLTTNVRNSMSEGTNSQNYTQSASHGISRGIRAWGGSFTMNASQSVGAAYGTLDRLIIPRVRHSGSLGWSTSSVESSTSARLSASDVRSYGSFKQKQQGQMYNFQLTRRDSLTRYSSLTGNVTAQVGRRSTLEAGSDGFQGSYYGTVVYKHSRWFNVPRLRFFSTLRVNAARVSSVNGMPRGIDLESWENRWDYYFGKVTSTLLFRVTGKDGKYTGSVAFSISRRFG